MKCCYGWIRSEFMTSRMGSEDKQAKLTEWLKTKLPQADELSITPLERVRGGYASRIRFFDLNWREGGQEKIEKLVLRQGPRTPPPGYDLALQFHTLRCLEASDVPAPKTYWLEEDEEVLGSSFFIMGKVEGEILDPQVPGQKPWGLLYDASPAKRTDMWKQAVEVIGRIHNLDWEHLGFSLLGVPKNRIDAIDRQITWYEKMARWAGVEPAPFLEAAFNWFKNNRFEPESISLCWGDARPGNLMYRNGKLAAVLDWDMANIGAPETDLAWFLAIDWMASEECAGLRVPRWDGLPEREETIRYYESVTGRKLDNFFYYETFALLAMGIIFSLVLKDLSGIPPEYVAPQVAFRKVANMLDIEGSL
jgi:aminoglycoside phosphotransferase (APT) family kinase protein